MPPANGTIALHALRRALADSGNRQRYIKTVVGRGYQLAPTIDKGEQAVRRVSYRAERITHRRCAQSR
jgi:DNA-binding winged helix-turn-helix (wHTH) protein